MTEFDSCASTKLKDLHEDSWELVSRFAYLEVVFSEAEADEWVGVCTEAKDAVQLIRESLWDAMFHDQEAAATTVQERLTRGGILAAQTIERLASAEMVRLGLE